MLEEHDTIDPSITALPQAVDHLHELHQLPVLVFFFYLLRLSERAYKGHTAFISSSSSFPFSRLIFSSIAT